ncbi:MAG: hypothetical protein C4335_07535 [Armatimonadota bacterium]
MARETLEDIIRALQEHPEWRQPLLEALLPERYQQLPERTDRLEQALTRLAEETEKRFRQLAEQQEANNRQIESLTAKMSQLAEHHRQIVARMDDLTARLEQLTARVDELTARVNDLTARLEQLTARVDELTIRLDRLVERVDSIQKDVGELKGFHLESYYRANATAILGLFFRRLRVVDKGQMIDSLYDQRPLSKQEWEQILAIDLLVTGRRRTTDEEWLMVWEISWTVDESDVERALERAAVLRERGWNTLPVVAGKGVTGNARSLAESHGVLVVLDSFPIDGSGIVQ